MHIFTQRTPNEALTLEELREMAKEPLKHWVWIQSEIHGGAYYRVHSDYSEGEAFCCGYPGYGFEFKYKDCGKTWLAYRRKVEG